MATDRPSIRFGAVGLAGARTQSESDRRIETFQRNVQRAFIETVQAMKSLHAALDATSSAVERMQHASRFAFRGDISAHPVSAATPTGGGGTSFWAFEPVDTAREIRMARLKQRETGNSGTTAVDVYRYRDGSWTFITALELLFGSDFDEVKAYPSTSGLAVGDVVAVRFRTVQAAGGANTPSDVLVEVFYQ